MLIENCWTSGEGRISSFRPDRILFLRADITARCVVTVTGQPVNLRDMLGMKVPCKIRLTGRPQYLRILEAQFVNM